MADKQGLLGSRSTDGTDDARSHGSDVMSAGRDDREAYEEDWYRSLRALAERQQPLAAPEEELEERQEPEPEEPAPLEAEAAAVEAADTPQPWEHQEDRPERDEREPDVTPQDRFAAAPFEGDLAPRLHVVPPVEEGVPAGPPLEETHGAAEVEPERRDLDEIPAFEQAETHRPGEPFEQSQTIGDVEPEHAELADLPELAPPGDLDEVLEPREAPPEVADPTAELPASWLQEGSHPEDRVEASVPQDEAPSFGDADPGSFEQAPSFEMPAHPPAEPEPAAEAPVDVEPPAPSLVSTDPHERRVALEELATHDLSEADTHRIEAVLLDPETDIRRLALQTLARRPDRVQEDAIRQALQDPTDEVREVAVELAAKRGQVAQIAPLLVARDWPLTHRAVLRLLPEVTSASTVDDDAMRRVLAAVGDLDPGPLPEERPAMGQLALALGSHRVLDALSWPDVPRLGAIRLLSHDRSPDVLRELATHNGDPLEEIREVATAAVEELLQAESARERIPLGESPQLDDGTDRIASLARALLDDDATVRHLALSGLAGMDRAALASWVRDAIGTGDAGQLSLAASTAYQLRLVEGAADILDAAAVLPVDARHSLVDALRSFVMPPDQLAALLPQVHPTSQPEAIRMLWQIGGPPVLPHLRPYLDDPSAPMRQAILDVFAESGDPSAVDVVRISLETDVSPVVRARAVRVLSQLTTAPPAAVIVRALSDPDPEVRATAIETLPDVDGPEAIDALTSSLSDQDDRVRLAASKRLAGRAADPELIWSALRRAPDSGRGDIIASFERVRSGSLTQIALERLRSPELEERILAVEVCGWGASPGCVEGAIQALGDPAAQVRRTATVALGRLHDPAAANALGKALGDPDPEVRIGVVRALGVIDDEAVLGFLVSALNDPDPRVRDVTSHVLTEWSSPAVARRLAGVLAVPRLREAATDLLTRIGPPAVELLIDVLMQHNPAVVPTVGDLLQRISQPDEFLSRLDAVEPERRLRGVEALGAIGGPAAVNALLRSVSDPDERIRARSAQLLAEVGDPNAREALMGLLRDPIPGVVAAAQDALSRLNDG